MKMIYLTACAIAVVLIAKPAFALGGCADSPENPTVILAGLAGGIYGARYLRTHIRSRKGR